MYMLRQLLARPEQKAGFGVLPHYSTYTYTILLEITVNISTKHFFFYVSLTLGYMEFQFS